MIEELVKVRSVFLIVISRRDKGLVACLIQVLVELSFIPDLIHIVNKLIISTSRSISSTSIKLQILTISSHIEPEATVVTLALQAFFVVTEFENGCRGILDVVKFKISRIQPKPHVVNLVIVIRIEHIL